MRSAADWIVDNLGVVAGAVVGGLLVLVALVLKGAGLAFQERAKTWTGARLDAVDRSRKKRAQRRAQEKRQRESERDLDRLRKERIGRTFLKRASRDDPGEVWEVLDLTPRAPRTNVIILRRAGATEADQWEGHDGRLSVKWSDLTKSPSEQRRMTARSEADTLDDADGYLWYEEITNDDERC